MPQTERKISDRRADCPFELIPTDRITSAVQQATNLHTNNPRWTDPGREFVGEKIIGLLNVANMLFKGDFSHGFEMVIYRLEEIAIQQGRINPDNPKADMTLFTSTIRCLSKNFDIKSRNVPRNIFADSINILNGRLLPQESPAAKPSPRATPFVSPEHKKRLTQKYPNESNEFK